MATFNSSPVEDIQLFSHFVMLVSPLCRCNPVRSALPHSPSDASNIMNSLMFATEDEFKVIIQKLTIIHDLSAPLIKLLRLRRHLKTTVIKLEEAKDIAKLDVWTFMGLELLTLSISLQLFFKICLSVASSEINFSKINLTQNYICNLPWYGQGLHVPILRYYQSNSRKALISIHKFAALKARKNIRSSVDVHKIIAEFLACNFVFAF